MRTSIVFLFLISVVGCQSQPTNLLSSTIAPKKKPEVHGHRGSRGTHPENTMAAFEEAAQSGAEWLELDLVLTQEDIPLVSHDPTVSIDFCLDSQKKPLTKVLPIKSLKLKRLKTFDCGSVPNPDFKEQVAVPGQKLPTLEEVLIWLNGPPAKKIKLNIETKMTAPKPGLEPSPAKFASTVVALLRKYGQVENSVLQSFDFRTLKEAKKLEPKLKLSALFEKPEAICKVTKDLGAQIAAPSFALVNPEMISECHSMGIEVHPWTLNLESDWKRALNLGVDGIITDYPRKLKTFLVSQ